MSGDAAPVSLAYRAALGLLRPPIARWGRLEVTGLEHLREPGAILLCVTHDSNADPVIVGIAALRADRAVRALAKSSLWKLGPLAPLLNAMGQIPVTRGTKDAAALKAAVEALEAGDCIGVFPEGTLSGGTVRRARSGLGRLAALAPDARIVGCAVEGSVDLLGSFPRRPRFRVTFFAPAGGDRREGETPGELSARVLAEARAIAPPRAAGLRRKVR